MARLIKAQTHQTHIKETEAAKADCCVALRFLCSCVHKVAPENTAKTAANAQLARTL